MKLFKAQRQLFDSLEATVLPLVLSLLRDKCKKLPATQQEVMRLLLAALQKRVVHLGQPIVSQDTRRSLQTLKKFSIGRLFEVVEQSRQVDAAEWCGYHAELCGWWALCCVVQRNGAALLRRVAAAVVYAAAAALKSEVRSLLMGACGIRISSE